MRRRSRTFRSVVDQYPRHEQLTRASWRRRAGSRPFRRCRHAGLADEELRASSSNWPRSRRTSRSLAHSQRPERRPQRRARNPCRHRRRRSRAVRRGFVPHVLALRGAQGVEGRRDVSSAKPASAASRKPSRRWRAAGLSLPEARKRRPSRAAGPGDRGERAHPHVHRDRRGPAGSRGGRHPNRPEGPASRHVLLERPRRTEREHDVFRRAHYPPPDRPRRLAAGREVPDEEPREGA